MSIENIIYKLPRKTVENIKDAIIESCLIYNLGGDYRKYLLKKYHASMGASKKIFAFMLTLDGDGLKLLEAAYLDTSNDLNQIV